MAPLYFDCLNSKLALSKDAAQSHIRPFKTACGQDTSQIALTVSIPVTWSPAAAERQQSTANRTFWNLTSEAD